MLRLLERILELPLKTFKAKLDELLAGQARIEAALKAQAESLARIEQAIKEDPLQAVELGLTEGTPEEQA